jgi:hypothetical protein
MIEQLNWHTTKIENMFFSDIHFRVHYGRTYHLSFKESTGYIIYTNQRIKDNAKSAYAMLGDTQLFLKWEDGFFRPFPHIYDAKTNCCIGKLNTAGFIINEIQYNLRRQKKSIFNRNMPFDLIFEADENYADMLLRMNINRVNKKWYSAYYMDELNGNVEFKNNIGYELILASFFYLHHKIQTLNHI